VIELGLIKSNDGVIELGLIKSNDGVIELGLIKSNQFHETEKAHPMLVPFRQGSD